MPEDSHTTRVTTGEDTLSPGTGKDSSVLEAIWDDEDTRAFYECLPDLRFVIPRAISSVSRESKFQKIPRRCFPRTQCIQESPSEHKCYKFN